MKGDAPIGDENFDRRVIERVVQFCRDELEQHGLLGVYFYGSRAVGEAKRSSDFDFYAVVSDGAPQGLTHDMTHPEHHLGVALSQEAWRVIAEEIEGVVVDLKVTTESTFRDAAANYPNSFSSKVLQANRQVFSATSSDGGPTEPIRR